MQKMFVPFLFFVFDVTLLQVGCVRAMLEMGVPVKSGDDTRLFGITRAAARNCPEIVELLLKHGVPVDGPVKITPFGTPLYQAVTSGPDCVDLLLKVCLLVSFECC
jgi:hypothetical protein